MSIRRIIITALFPAFAASASVLLAQAPGTTNAIPRVEVHAHIGSIEMADDVLRVAELLKQRHGISLAAVLNLQLFLPVGNPPQLTPEFFDEVERRYQGRILSCVGDYDVNRGLRYSPDQLASWQQRGVVGYKIWYPVVIGHTAPAKDQFTIHAPDYPGIDSPANEPVFDAMERLGLVGTCIHIGQAHPRRWQNPVHFWTPIQQWLRVLDRHPRMVVVMAHMMNLFYSDEQLDFLGYVLETYPNLHVELGGRMIDFHAMRREHLREFFIRYADRILFGTDLAPAALRLGVEQATEDYYYKFQLLESDGVVKPGAVSAKAAPARGLGLPREVLEKIYYRNAVRIYPRLKAVLRQQGHEVP